MRTNQAGKPVEEQPLFPYFEEHASLDDIKKAISLLCEKLDVSIKRTNATKHGTIEVILEEN